MKKMKLGEGIQSDWMEAVLVWSGKVSLKTQHVSRNRRKQLCRYLGETIPSYGAQVVAESLVWPVCLTGEGREK